MMACIRWYRRAIGSDALVHSSPMRLSRHSSFRASWRPSLTLLLIAFAFFNTLTWSLTQPPNTGFDEQGYLKVAAFIEQHHRWPIFDEDDGFGVEFLNIGSGAPPYPYLPYADRPGGPLLVAAATMALPTDSVWMDSFQSRVPGSVYAALLTLFTVLAAQSMFPGRRALAWFAGSLAATWPQVSTVFGTLNDDAFMTMACAGLIWRWYAGARSGWSVRSSVLLGVFMGLVLLGKPNGYILLAATVFVAASTLRGRPLQVLGRLGAAFAAMVAVAGWRFAILVHDYGLDFTNTARKTEIVKAAGAKNYPAQDFGFSFWEVLTSSKVQTPTASGQYIPSSADMFLSNFSHFHFRLPFGERMFVFGLLCIALSELVLWSFGNLPRMRRSLRISRASRVHLVTAALVPVTVLAAAWNAYRNEYILAGHYWFPMLVPVLMTFAAGLWLHVRRYSRGAIALAVVAFAMGAINLHGRDIVGAAYNQSLDYYFTHWQAVIVWPWVLTGILVVASMAREAIAGPRVARRIDRDPPTASGGPSVPS